MKNINLISLIVALLCVFAACDAVAGSTVDTFRPRDAFVYKQAGEPLNLEGKSEDLEAFRSYLASNPVHVQIKRRKHQRDDDRIRAYARTHITAGRRPFTGTLASERHNREQRALVDDLAGTYGFSQQTLPSENSVLVVIWHDKPDRITKQRIKNRVKSFGQKRKDDLRRAIVEVYSPIDPESLDIEYDWPVVEIPSFRSTIVFRAEVIFWKRGFDGTADEKLAWHLVTLEAVRRVEDLRPKPSARPGAHGGSGLAVLPTGPSYAALRASWSCDETKLAEIRFETWADQIVLACPGLSRQEFEERKAVACHALQDGMPNAYHADGRASLTDPGDMGSCLRVIDSKVWYWLNKLGR